MRSEQHVSSEDVERYVAGVMDVDDIPAFEAHVGECEACGRSLQREAALDMALLEAAGGLDGGLGAVDAPRAVDGSGDLTRMDGIPRLHRLRSVALVSAAIAAAAAVAVLLLRPGPPPAEDLPAYRLEATGGARIVRSVDPAPEGLPRFRTGDRMQLDLRPDESSPISPQILVFLEQIDGANVVDGVTWQVADSGALRGVATVGGSLRLPPGEHRLILALAPGDTPFDSARIEACHAGGEGPWQTFNYRFEVVEP